MNLHPSCLVQFASERTQACPTIGNVDGASLDAWQARSLGSQAGTMDDPNTGSLDAEARLYALESAVRMLVTIVMKDQPGTLTSIAASIRASCSAMPG